MRKKAVWACAGVLLLSLAAWAGTDVGDLVGTWEGTLSNGMGGQIRVVVHLSQTPDGLSATMDSPDQNATGIPVAKATFVDGKLSLDVAKVGGSYLGTFDGAKGEISGNWPQSGQTIPLVLKKKPAGK